mgnify:CR=1 FL=1
MQINRRGFIGALTGMVAALFGKRAEAKPVEIVKPAFVPGDIVEFEPVNMPWKFNENCWIFVGVVIDNECSMLKVQTPHGTCYMQPEEVTKVGHVVDLQPGRHRIYGVVGQVIAYATLCRPTERVKTGQVLASDQWKKMDQVTNRVYLGPSYSYMLTEKSAVIGIATSDCEPGGWCWCVPQMKMEGWPIVWDKQPWIDSSLPKDVSPFTTL